MNKVLNLLLKHIEKIIFAITMIILIVLISIQLQSFKGLQTDIKEAKEEARELRETGAVKPVPAIDTSIFDMKIEVQEPWMPAYTAGDWNTYRESGDPRIFRDHRHPPSTLAEPYQAYLEEFGAGSLFDPPLYVLPLDGKNNILSFESTNAFYSPYNSDLSTKKTLVKSSDDDDDDDTTPGDDDDDDNNNKPDYIPATLVRIYKTRMPTLDFKLTSVMANDIKKADTWDLTFKIKDGSTKFVRVGKEIPSTSYTVLSAKREMVDGGGFQKAMFTVMVAHKDSMDQAIKMEQNKIANNPFDSAYFDLLYYPTRKIYKKLKDGNQLKLKNKKGKTHRYELQGDTDSLRLIELVNNAPEGKEYTLKKYKKSDYDKWRRNSRKKRTSDTP